MSEEEFKSFRGIEEGSQNGKEKDNLERMVFDILSHAE